MEEYDMSFEINKVRETAKSKVSYFIRDDKGNVISIGYPDGVSIGYKYSENGLLEQISSMDLILASIEYDSKGNKIYTRYDTNQEYWYEYDFYPNGVIMTIRQYLGV